jgi:putative ABC transport system ATP-binding protein
MSEGHPLLALDSVSRFYENGSVRALDQVSLRANAGETIALTGASGCGKSTLLSLIGLLDQPTAGRLQIGGQDLAAVARPSAFRARTLGFVFQFHHMVPTMTLLENVAAPMIALGVARAERLERAHAMLAEMDLGHRAGFLPSRVSGGERQRAAVARALINRPPVLLADEPTGNLDSRNGARVIDLLLGHARSQGALVLVATHNPDIAGACDRRIELRDGRLVAARPARTTPALLCANLDAS